MKIKRNELESLKNFLYKQTQAFEADLAEAQSTAQSLASSQALRGDVKTAINHELNYYNLPLLQGYVDYSNLLYTEFDNLISDFESTVGEKSATAVINSEALTSLKQSVDGLHSSIVRDMDATNKYYTEISDLILLKAPSKDKLDRAIEASKQSLSETEKRLAAFNGKQATSELDAILNNQNKGLTKVSGTVTMASPYRNPEALDIYRNPHFKKAANRYHQKVDSLARAYFQKNHPGVAFDKDKAGIEELQALAREVTKKTVTTGDKSDERYLEYLETFKNSISFISYGITGHLASREAIASYHKIKNGTWCGKRVKSTTSGYKTWKQVNGDVSRYKAVQNAKRLDELANGTGTVVRGTGIKGVAKSVGILGGSLAVLDGGLTYLERKDEYGETSATIDGVAHTTTSIGAIYVGAAVGNFIPVPVVGALAGAATGYLVGGIANTLYDGFAHGKWNWDNFKLW